MRFLADENFPGPSVRALRSAGYDIAWVSEVVAGARDPQVLAMAVEQERVLVTLDSDHGRLIFMNGHPAPPGVVHLRFVQGTPTEAAEIVAWLIERTELHLLGEYTVVRRNAVRQRRLPRERL